jgi:type II secretory pathway pseudopilin PulG
MKYPRQNSLRSARALVCVVVCMGIATTITMKSMQTAIRMRRQMGREIQMEQTRWLLQAASLRAANRLRADREYSGETLNIGPALPAYSDATIEITVTPTGTGQRLVAATCRIGPGNHPAASTRRSDQWLVELSENRTNE